MREKKKIFITFPLRLTLIILTIILCYPFHSIAQINLIPNGNFEETVKCGEKTVAVKNWFIPQKQENNPDNPCPVLDWWRFIHDRNEGVNKTRCGYIETYYKGFADDFLYSGRRYLAVKLVQKLEKGQQYYFEMKVRSLDTFPNFKLVNTVFTDGQDVAFTREFPLFDSDKRRHFMDIKTTFRSKMQKNYDWFLVNGCFIADGTEQYLVIGNFRHDDNTTAVPTGKKNPNFLEGQNADYCIDNVILLAMKPTLRDTAICENETFRANALRNIPENVTYRWQDGSTLPYFDAKKDGIYRVEIRYPNDCPLLDKMKLRIIEKIEEPTTVDTLICQGKSIDLWAGTGRKEEIISWDFEKNKNRGLKVNQTGTFRATINNTCSEWTDIFTVKTQDCGEGFYFPTAFSPNNDAINDEIKPFFKADFREIISYSLKIFNRWGEKLFETNDQNAAWNGNFKNQLQVNDTYIWLIQIEFYEKNKVKSASFAGEFVLIK